ncbi:MAG: methyltransferase domain-containing protein [Capsulimonadales bacterium]|nr:methyltransferase domain-containing protein [Capsulimonadales bacterium]
MTNPWETFFTGHAPTYEENGFTKNTEAEVAFLIEALPLSPGDAVLDIGCGTGRHSIALARHGCRVTGVDLTPAMLDRARAGAEAAGVTVEWVLSNAAQFRRDGAFDAAICLCEGAFSLLGTDDDPIERDLRILRNIASSLKPGGTFLLTTLNAHRLIRAVTPEQVRTGRFDLVTLVETETMELPDGGGTVTVRSRVYVPTEIRLMLEIAGFSVEAIGSGSAGAWGISETRRPPVGGLVHPLEPDEMEFLVLARKRA